MNLYQEAELGCLWLIDHNWLCVWVFSPSFVCAWRSQKRQGCVRGVSRLFSLFLCVLLHRFTLQVLMLKSDFFDQIWFFSVNVALGRGCLADLSHSDVLSRTAVQRESTWRYENIWQIQNWEINEMRTNKVMQADRPGRPFESVSLPESRNQRKSYTDLCMVLLFILPVDN